MNHRVVTCGFGLALSSVMGMATGCTYEPPTASSGGPGGASTGGFGGQGGSSGQGGGSAMCPPESKPMCGSYSGPAGTLDIGFCRAAEPVCGFDAKWTCGAEVLPSPEFCNSPGDVNCDTLDKCQGKLIAANPYAASQTMKDELIVSIATSAAKNYVNGNTYAVGFRGADLTPAGPVGPNVLAWRRTPDGVMQNWAPKFDFAPSIAPTGAQLTGVVVLPKSGEVVISGVFYNGTMTIDNKTITTTSAKSFLVKLDPLGTIQRVAWLGDGGSLSIRGIATDSMDNIYLAGDFDGTPLLINGNYLPSALTLNGFVASLSPDGGFRWAKAIAGPGEQKVHAVAVINDSAIAAAATIVNTTNLAGTMLDAGPDPDIVVMRMTAAGGTVEWTKNVLEGNLNSVVFFGGLAASADKVVVGGSFYGPTTFNSLKVSNPDLPPNSDYFVATLEPTLGSFTRSVAQHFSGVQDLHAISIDTAGDIVLAGAYSETVPFPGVVSIDPSKGVDPFVMKVRPDLSEAYWARRFGDMAPQAATAIGHGQATGSLFIGGGFQGEIPAFQPPLASVPSDRFDAFLIELSN